MPDDTVAVASSDGEAFARWALNAVPLRGTEWVLDAGCGDGLFLPALLRKVPHGLVVGLDHDPSQLGAAAARLTGAERQCMLLLGDMQTLPFTGGTFDLVLANFVLSAVDDLAAALSEIWRVLQPGGHLLAATTARPHQQELWALHWGAMADLGLGRPQAHALAAATMGRFTLETGADLLREQFADVELFQQTRSVPTTVTALVADYAASAACAVVAARFAPPARRAALRQQLAERVRQRAESIVQQAGDLSLTYDLGVLLARK